MNNENENENEQIISWLDDINNKDSQPNPSSCIEAMCAYRHFKGNLYYVIGTALHTETSEKMVVYHALYGDSQIYVRPLNMFLEEVPKDVANPTGQKYRFEKISNSKKRG